MRSASLNSSIRLLVLGTLASGLIACGGGGGGSAPAAAPAVTVSGIVTYTDYNLSAAGIDYDNPNERPIRGAIAELRNSSGSVLASTNTTEAGAYSLSAPANSTVRVVIKAALGSPNSPDTKVVDNTSSGTLYVTGMDITTATSNLSQNFNAGSGWDGSSYSGTRAAAPFAILDVIYEGQKLVRSVDSTVVFTPLDVNWSPKNKTTDGDVTIGEINTSSYDHTKKALYILGAENLDTDEYDSHVIAHEWGHYFEANHSRSDNVGGPHESGDILHPSVAFGEGYGYALSGMILNDPLIIDTTGPGQNNGSIDNLEADSIADNAKEKNGLLYDGYYSETSVQEVLYDIFDSGSSDDDALELGFTPIYKVLTSGQKNTESFTSIFSFLYYLKREVPASAAVIDALAGAENINSASDDEFQDPIDPVLYYLYTTIDPAGGLITVAGEGDPLQTYNLFGDASAQYTGNKIYNHRFFRSTVTTAGCYSLTVTPVTPTATADVAVLFAGNTTGLDVGFGGDAETTADTFSAGEITVFSVSAFANNVSFNVLFTSTPSACTP